jgi:hypothetical protein
MQNADSLILSQKKKHWERGHGICLAPFSVKKFIKNICLKKYNSRIILNFIAFGEYSNTTSGNGELYGMRQAEDSRNLPKR